MHYHKEFDRFVAAGIARFPKRFYPLMDYASRVGGSFFAISSLLIVILWSLSDKQPGLLAYTIAVAVVIPLAELAKLVTRRPRPETLYARNMRFKSYSFPSGHAYTSSLMACFLASLAAAYLDSPFSWLGAISALAFSALVGVSRVYLGAHFPTDVIAGWALGILVWYLISAMGLAVT